MNSDTYIDQVKRPPGPSGLASIKFLLSVSSNFAIAFNETRKKYGDVFYYKFQGQEWFVFSTASAAQRILKDNLKNYSKEIPQWLLGDVMGQGLVLTEGEKWKTQRKTVASTFHHKNIEAMIPMVARLTKELFKEHNGEQVNLSSILNWLSMKVAAACFLGEDLTQDEMVKINEYLPEYSNLAALKLQDPTRNIEWLPTPRNLRAKKLRKELNQISERITTSGQKQELSSKNIVTNILKSAEEQKIDVSFLELQHQIFTFLAAGHETTSNLLSWTLYLIDAHPKIKKTVFKELSTFDEKSLSVENLNSLTYLEAVIKESLRLYPPVPSLMRVAVEDDEIDGHFVPKGSVVPVVQYLIHRNERYWPNPDEFVPERFLAEDYKETYTPFSFIAFSGGPRGCIGESFAYLESKVILAHLLKNYDYKIINSDKITSKAAVTLRPSPDLKGWLKPLE